VSQNRVLSRLTRVFPQHDNVVARFAGACRRADTAALREILDRAAFAVCDGVLEPAYGEDDVARLVTAVLCGRPATGLTVESVNGRAGLALRRAGAALAVVAVQVTGDHVTGLWIVVDPARLHGWHHP
jgi:hypothetical protein